MKSPPVKRPAAVLRPALFILALATPAAADPVATVRSGDHLNYGRIVVDTDGAASFHVGHDGDRVTVQFDSKIMLGSAPPPPRNVHAITTSGTSIELRVAEGARVQTSHQGGKVVVDIMDPLAAAAPLRPHEVIDAAQPPPSTLPPQAAAAKAGAPPAPAVPPPAAGTRPAIVPAADGVVAGAASPVTAPQAGTAQPPHAPEPPARADAAVAAPATSPRTPVLATPLAVPSAATPMAAAASAPSAATPAAPPLPAETDAAEDEDRLRPLPPGRDVAPELAEASLDLLVRRTRLPHDAAGSAILAPFAPTTGAAAFTDADGIAVIFDERRPLDMTALGTDPVFGGATIRLLANGTLLHLPKLADGNLVLTRLARGWRLASVPAQPRLRPVTFAVSEGKVSLAAEAPNAVLSMADPRTGATLLVGTQLRPGQGVLSPRRTTEFELHPSLMGVVIEPLSDRIGLKPAATGFQLSGGPDGLFISPQTSMTDVLVDAAHLTRRYSFSTMQPEGLRALLQQQIEAASNTPPLARGALNHRAAETMLALGMGAEAESLLQLAAQQDPNEAASADNAGLTAIAALLAGRVGEAEPLADRRLDGTDEIALWRAVREATLDEGSPAAAAVFTATAPLAMVYPAALRAHILPLILETMVQGGEIAPAKRLLAQLPDDAAVAYARALLRQAEGDVDGALGQFDSLADGHDQYNRIRAAVRAVELRLAAKKLNTQQAADALDRLLYAWRGDRRELALRERVAELRALNGQWTDALNLLRQARQDFPDQADEIRGRLRETFTAMVHDTNTQHLRPLEFVSLVDENAELVRDTQVEEGVDRKLADDLLALDLPQRAKPVLEKLLASAGTDEARTRYGLSLATLHDREGDPVGALEILDQYHGAELPGGLAEARLLVRASATARKGDIKGAVALLAPVRTTSATEARAGLEESAGDWPAAEQAWADCVALAVPPEGALDEAESRTVLRLATATAHASDEAGIGKLREQYSGRIAPGPLNDMFRLLTAEPVQTTADIPRSSKETSLAAALPGSLNALKSDPMAH